MREDRREDRRQREEYAAARWPVLVRSVVLLGVPVDHAVRQVRDAVADWRDDPADAGAGDTGAGGDLDTSLYDAVLATHLADRVPWWSGVGGPDLEPTLRSILDALPPAARLDVVRRALDHAEEESSAPANGVRLAAAAVDVPPPDLPARGMRGPAARQRRRAMLGSALALALVVAGLATTIVVTRDDSRTAAAGADTATTPRTPRGRAARGNGDTVRIPPPVVSVRGTVPLAWYDGVSVRLPDGRSVPVDDVVDLAGIDGIDGGGALALTDEGRLVLVRPDGTASPFDAGGRGGAVTSYAVDGTLVAYVTETGPDGPGSDGPGSDGLSTELVVASLASEEPVLETDLPGGSTVVHLDSRTGGGAVVDTPDGQGLVVYLDPAETPAGSPTTVLTADVVAIGGRDGDRTQVLRSVAARLLISQVGLEARRVLGDEASVSDDGRTVLVQVGSGAGASYRAVDVGTGRVLPMALPITSYAFDGRPGARGQLVLVGSPAWDVELVDDRTVVAVVTRDDDAGERRGELRTTPFRLFRCDLTTGACTPLADVAAVGPPLLAH